MGSDIFDIISREQQIKEMPEKKDIFSQLSEEKEKPESKTKSILKQAGQFVQEGTKSFVEKGLGTYGDLFDFLGIQLSQDQMNKLIELEQSQESPDTELMEKYTRIPSSKDIKNLLGKIGIETKEPETVAGKYGKRIGGALGTSTAFGGIGAIPMAAGAAVGQTTEELTGSPLAGDITELATSLRADKALGKYLLPGKKTQELVKFGKEIGLTDKELTPLIKSKEQLAFFSKFAKKGPKQEELIQKIGETLGNAYENIKDKASKLPEIFTKHKEELSQDLKNIVEKLKKTVKTTPEQENAIKFLTEASENLENKTQSVDSLINFYQNINAAVDWRKIAGKSMVAAKNPILQIIEKESPEIANDFKLLNKLFSKSKDVEKYLSPDIFDKYKELGEYGMLIGGIFHPASYKALAFESLISRGSTQFLTNPRYTDMSRKLLKALSEDKPRTVLSIGKKMNDWMERKSKD